MVKIGVLGLQGAVREHVKSFEASGAELMKAGFYLCPQVTKDFVGRLFYVEAIK